MSIYHYWGKSRRGETDGGDDYHLLCWHSLDVAAVGYWMVINNIYFIDHYLKKLGIQDKEQAAQFFATQSQGKSQFINFYSNCEFLSG